MPSTTKFALRQVKLSSIVKLLLGSEVAPCGAVDSKLNFTLYIIQNFTVNIVNNFTFASAKT